MFLYTKNYKAQNPAQIESKQRRLYMYLPQKFYDQYKIKIPSGFVYDMGNKYDLPVYISLMLSYTPFCKEPFSVKRILKLTRVFKTENTRNKSMRYVADALLRLEEYGYIKIQYCNGISLKDSIVKSNFSFTVIAKSNIENFMYINARELDALLIALNGIPSDTCHYSLCTLLHVYCLIRMNSYIWQRSYEYLYPAWIGNFSEIYKLLNISKKAISDSVKILRENNIISVCYGSMNEELTERQKTIIIFNKAIEEQNIDSVIYQVKERYNKSNKVNGTWYPPNLTVANSASNGVINKAQ